MVSKLNPEELERYTKHLQLPEIGIAGQQKLKAASVLIVGTGGLGSPAALYLAASGVGRIGLLDNDQVALSNLQRQVLHSVKTIGVDKPASGAAVLRNLNPGITVIEHATRLTEENAQQLIEPYDLVLDCTDNLPARQGINRVCVAQGKAMVHGAVFKFEGQVGVFHTPEGPCYACLYPQSPREEVIPDPAKNGLVSTAPGVIGVIQANEALKLILGIGTPLIGRLLQANLLEMQFREIRLKRNLDCPVCGSLHKIIQTGL